MTAVEEKKSAAPTSVVRPGPDRKNVDRREVGVKIDLADAVRDNVFSENGNPDGIHWGWDGHVGVARAMIDQYHHAIDVVPTLLDCVGVDLPDTVKGYTQHPIDQRVCRQACRVPVRERGRLQGDSRERRPACPGRRDSRGFRCCNCQGGVGHRVW